MWLKCVVELADKKRQDCSVGRGRGARQVRKSPPFKQGYGMCKSNHRSLDHCLTSSVYSSTFPTSTRLAVLPLLLCRLEDLSDLIDVSIWTIRDHVVLTRFVAVSRVRQAAHVGIVMAFAFQVRVVRPEPPRMEELERYVILSFFLFSDLSDSDFLVKVLAYKKAVKKVHAVAASLGLLHRPLVT